MSFNDFSDFMPTDNTDGILLESGEVLVSYDLGNGEVKLTLNELAEELELDPLVLRDYYIRYNKNLPVAILGAQNDKNMEDSVDFVRHSLGITYIVEHNIQDIIRKYNKLLGIKTKVLKQMEYFMTFNNGNDDAELTISGEQLKTLMLRSLTAARVIPRSLNLPKNTIPKIIYNPIGMRKALFDVASKKVVIAPLYATDDKVATMKKIAAIANGERDNYSEADILTIRKNLPANTSRNIIGNLIDPQYSVGLKLTADELKGIYDFFTTYQIPISENVEVFEELSATYELEKDSIKMEDEGPLLRMKKQ